MDVVYPRHFDGVEKTLRFEQAVVDAVYIDVIDVQMDAAIGFLRHGVEKLDFPYIEIRIIASCY